MISNHRSTKTDREPKINTFRYATKLDYTSNNVNAFIKHTNNNTKDFFKSSWTFVMCKTYTTLNVHKQQSQHCKV